MNLSMNNICVKPHSNFLPEVQPPTNFLSTRSHITENNNQINNNSDKTVQEVWSKYNFNVDNNSESVNKKSKAEIGKMSWATVKEKEIREALVEEPEQVMNVEENGKEHQVEVSRKDEEKEAEESPSHHARRPMNAFLIFCKKHRPIVRDRYPNLENRGVTRILGEWWALLDENDKSPYTNLAKEYKDAFLSANPNFKWYKLPAPPLRTLSVRPSSTTKIAPPSISSPVENISPKNGSEFNLGKLADESQLGSLTSLMNTNFTSHNNKSDKSKENNNNIEEQNGEMYDGSMESPTNLIKAALPSKPFKKRNFEKHPPSENHSKVVRNILNSCDQQQQSRDESTMTNQDLMDKVVDKIYTKEDVYEGLKSQDIVRKSERQCKGKIYQKFMVEGKLLGNKRDIKLASQKYSDSERIEYEFNSKINETTTPNLDNTIKRLAERTNMQKLLEPEDGNERHESDTMTLDTPENNSSKSNSQNDFNLDLRISNLPSLSYEVFYQRKKESKKRKNRIKTDDTKGNKVPKLAKNEQQQPVGSKKRKNKQTITHLEKKEDGVGSDLLALATLAEVAANTEKIN